MRTHRRPSIAASGTDTHTPPPGYEAFSTVFRGPSDPLLPQGMHRFQHGAIGAFDLFTIRIRWEQHRLYSEAVFNRRREQARDPRKDRFSHQVLPSHWTRWKRPRVKAVLNLKKTIAVDQ